MSNSITDTSSSLNVQERINSFRQLGEKSKKYPKGLLIHWAEPWYYISFPLWVKGVFETQPFAVVLALVAYKKKQKKPLI
ncbi:hypothetical protein P364_0130945 [Paenibacillus sp. MAEPY2]|nr:hypothetical protein P364_0130945 [Paenibacillus sp. MAEPY2]KGP79096.1 hypothetical protein P363_0131355 [Paenibacillus sp. MAEPY1]